MPGSLEQSRPRPQYPIASVDNALQLAALIQMEGEITVGVAAERLNVAPSTAHRLLAMLVYRDFAIRDGRVYRVGPVLMFGSQRPSMLSRLREAAAVPLTMLDEEFDETATLAIRTDRTVRFVAEVECSHQLRVGHRTGMVFPAHKTAVGLALLAELDNDELERLYDPERFVEGESVPDLAMLSRRVESVRAQGFAYTNGLYEPGVVSVATLVRGIGGAPLASLSVAMPENRWNPHALKPLVAGLKRAARDVEARLVEDARHEPANGDWHSHLVV